MSNRPKRTIELKALLSLIKTEFTRPLPLFLIDWLIPKNKNIFIYGAFAGELYGENSRFLFEYAMKHEPQIKHYWVTANKELYLKLKSQFPDNVIYARSLKGFFTILRAKVVFTSIHLTDVYYFLTKRHLNINLYHGVTLKRIEYCSNARRHPAFHLAELLYKNKYSYITASSTVEKFMLSKEFNISHEKVIVTGMPRNDILNYNYLNESFSYLNDYKSVVLYAPTFRNNEPPKFFPFDDFNVTELEKFLTENNILLILRGHSASTVSKASKIYKRTWDSNEFNNLKNIRVLNHDRLADINTIFSRVDLVITDYSGVYYDFLLTDKPVMFIPYDLQKYESEVGLLYEYDSVTPGPKVANFLDFKKEVLNLLNNKEYFAKERLFVKNLFFKYQDDLAGKRIIDFVKGIIKQK